jgi:hypothetical protein
MSSPETDLTKTGETVFTEPAVGTSVPSLPAVDGRKVVGRIKVTTVNPGSGDDDTLGYAPGLRWVNTTNPVKSFVCVDDSTGAAIWVREGNIKINITAGDPAVGNDNTEGYEVGSIWINTNDGTTFVATGVATGAAAWKTSSLSGATPVVNPGELMFGTLLDYPSAGNVTASTVFFLRLKISAGVVIANMRTFIDSGGTASRNLRMGVYSQATPSDPNADPLTRVAQTAADDTAGDSGLFKTIPLEGGNYTIPETGFYWLALLADSTSIKFAVSSAVRANFLPVRQESSVGTTLPATTGVLANPVSAVLYLAAVEA